MFKNLQHKKNSYFSVRLLKESQTKTRSIVKKRILNSQIKEKNSTLKIKKRSTFYKINVKFYINKL